MLNISSAYGNFSGYNMRPSVTSNVSVSTPASVPVSTPGSDPVSGSASGHVSAPVSRPLPGSSSVSLPEASRPVSSGKPAVKLPLALSHEISPYAVTNELEAREAGLSEGQIRGLKKAGQIECATCAGRMYQDGSDENVSFKSAAHVSPTAAGAAVRSHEGEHVSNAYKKAAMNNGKVMRASVSIHMAICPECGRSYVSGGTTSTSIKYYGDNSPLAAHQKSFDEAAGIKGRFVDAGV